LQVGDTTLVIGYADTITYNGQTYDRNSEGLVDNQTEWTHKTGVTFKSGVNFNLTEKSNIFMNAGYLSRTPQFSNVIDNTKNALFGNILNEKILAFEAGYGFRSKKVSLNVNTYFTRWENRPLPFGVQIPDPEDPSEYLTVNVPGMDALHMGGEIDISYKVFSKLTLEGMVSIGDWTWRSSETVAVYNSSFTFDAKGVHVGDAAQSTYGASLRYSFIKNGYVTVKYNFFDRYYSNFNPNDLQGANGGRESWRIPSYGLMSIHAGYTVNFEKSRLIVRGNVFNALNSLYISDARNNFSGTSFAFDANSASVFVGQGASFNLSLGFEF
jgi:iron complex outermembrane receptor protein